MTRRRLFLSGILALAIATPAQAGIIYSSNFNANNGGLTAFNVGGSSSNPWTYSATGGVSGSGGWFINGINSISTKALFSANLVVTGNGPVTISFEHRRNFEYLNSTTGYDGGALYASVNGGTYTYVSGSNFTQNGYSHTISSGFGSFLGGLQAFSGGSSTSAYITSIATLGSLNAGDTISFLFLGAWDSSVNSSGDPDWKIDNIVVTDTSPTGIVVPAPPTLLLGIMGIGVTGVARWRRRRISA